MSYIDIAHNEHPTVSHLNYALANAAIAEGWDVTSVAAISPIFTNSSSWPLPFVPGAALAWGISRDGGASGVILTPPTEGSYTPPAGYSRQDMSSPPQGLQFVPQFMSGLDGYKTQITQVAPLGQTGYYISWYPPDSDDGNGGIKKFYNVTRPLLETWHKKWIIGTALDIQSGPPSYGGYILKSQNINGSSITIWLDNGADVNDFQPDLNSRFYVTSSELKPIPHPRTDAGKPTDSSSILALLAANQAATVYVNSKNFWSMANEVVLGLIPHWYAMNLKPRPGISNAVMLAGEDFQPFQRGPRFMQPAPVWWLRFNSVVFIKPTNQITMQLGRLHSFAGDAVAIKWDDDVTECLETFVFILDTDNNTYAICGLMEDVLIGHSTVGSDIDVPYDGDNFVKIAGTGGAGVMVRN